MCFFFGLNIVLRHVEVLVSWVTLLTMIRVTLGLPT